MNPPLSGRSEMKMSLNNPEDITAVKFTNYRDVGRREKAGKAWLPCRHVMEKNREIVLQSKVPVRSPTDYTDCQLLHNFMTFKSA